MPTLSGIYIWDCCTVTWNMRLLPLIQSGDALQAVIGLLTFLTFLERTRSEVIEMSRTQPTSGSPASFSFPFLFPPSSIPIALVLVVAVAAAAVALVILLLLLQNHKSILALSLLPPPLFFCPLSLLQATSNKQPQSPQLLYRQQHLSTILRQPYFSQRMPHLDLDARNAYHHHHPPVPQRQPPGHGAEHTQWNPHHLVDNAMAKPFREYLTSYPYFPTHSVALPVTHLWC